jgi:soluble lytic murein transglycosylase-like protein
VLYAGGASEQSSKGVTTVIRADRHTGKLVRAVVVATPSPESASSPAKDVFAPAVDRAAAEQALPPELIHSVIKVESNYNPYSLSPKGAQGLMQLIPATARRFGVDNPSDPVENIRGGARYLKYLLDLYHGDYPLALAAYNAGEQAVARYGGVPPFAETRNYVDLVQKQLLENGKRISAPAEPRPTPSDPAGPAHIQEIVEPDGSVRYVSR